VGRPPPGRDAIGYLLASMTTSELATYAPIIERAAEAAQAIVVSGVERAMNKFNTRV
jgi:peptidyl-tRNA hydrolase